MSGMREEFPNSDILLIYEAKNCNPNGDPDAENKPRMDYKTSVNLVSDVRLKRYFRDYIVEKFGEDYVYVTKIGGKSVRADSRVEKLLGKFEEERVNEVLEKCIDARLFGATIPKGKEEEKDKGAAISFIGPVQFAWGFSLHKVELMDSSAITSIFSGREETEEYGTIGRDWRVYYSLIGFYGVVSGRRAKGTKMTARDLEVFDNLIWTALQVQPTTRSKIGEKPHLYIRLEYNDADTVLGDLRRLIDVKPKSEGVRDLNDLDLNFEKLVEYIKNNDNLLSRVYLRTSDELSYLTERFKEVYKEKLFLLPHMLKDEEIKAAIKGETG